MVHFMPKFESFNYNHSSLNSLLRHDNNMTLMSTIWHNLNRIGTRVLNSNLDIIMMN